MDENKVTYFAQTDSRNKQVPFGIKSKDRTRHVYVIGKTGMGKSTLLENMAVQDIQNGEGFAFIDPHGKTADLLMEYIPEHRMKDVLYFAPFDLEHPISFNVLEKVDPDKRHLVVSGLMSTFKKIWQDAWSARMEYILTNTLLALLEYPGATLLGVNRMLSDKEYRKKVVTNITDPSVKTFWTEEFANYTERMAAEAVPAIQNKVGQFTANPLIRNMIGQSESTFDIREMMDNKKILIINLSKGRIGESNANLLGGMLITKIYLAAMSRADVPDRVLKTLPNFYLFVDEFQNFANESFADILSEARKYKLNLTIAHQYIEQMEEEVRAAVFGNVGTMIIFRVGSYDAEILEKEFAPLFTAEDIVNLGFAQIYLKLMIDGISSQPFSATTLPPIMEPAQSFRDKIVECSRTQFSRSRALVEEEIKAWMKPAMSAGALPKKEGEMGNFPPKEMPKKPAISPALGESLKSLLKQAGVKDERGKKEAVPAKQETKVDTKPVSLEKLKMPTMKKNDAKEPTEKNLSELRAALGSVIKKDVPNTSQQAKVEPKPSTPQPQVERKIETKTDVHSEAKREQPAPQRTETPKESLREVPKDVLTTILKVEK
jgi:hypothetical protein